MRALPGYALGEEVPTGSGLVSYRARRVRDGRAVRVVLPGGHRRELAERLLYASELAHELDLAGVARPAETIHRGDGTFLVFEEDASVPLASLLAEGPLSLRYALGVAASAAEVLGQLHARGVVHNDICPGSLLVGQEGVHLDCLGMATRFGLEQPHLERPAMHGGELAFLSPERTGRVARAVDHRSDLYALGAVLYTILAGAPPFHSRDPLEVIYAHLALEARPLRPLVPDVVDAIVSRLMAKDAEDRYQSALGVAHDLRRCLRTVDDRLQISWFEPGAADVPSVYRVPDRLYERDDELELLSAAWRRARAGEPGLVSVTGASGTGKTALVRALRASLASESCLFAAGKAEQLQSLPLGTFIPAIRDLAAQLLAEPLERLERRRATLREALGPALGGVLVELVPELEAVLGHQPTADPLPPAERQSRLLLALQRLVDALALPDQPLVLFLDDVQWIEAASVQLLERLLSGAGRASVLVVLAWREGEGNALEAALAELRSTPVASSRVELGPLSARAVAALVADSLATTPDEVVELASVVSTRTAGNPLFVTQLLDAFAAGGIIHQDPVTRRWRWDRGRIAQASYSDDVAELMADRLAALPEEARELLSVAAALGNRFALRTLAAVQDATSGRVARTLLPAMEEGLLLASGVGLRLAGEAVAVERNIHLRFPHDRVQEVAYGLIPPAELPAVHARVGRALRLAGADPFEVSYHLVRAAPLLRDPDERLEVARLHLAAGQRAQQTTDYVTALSCHVAGIELLTTDAWEHHRQLAFDLHRHRAECLHLTGAFDEAEAAFLDLEARSVGDAEWVELVNNRVGLLLNQGRIKAAVELGFAGCAGLGFDLPTTTEQWVATTRVELGSVLRVMGELEHADLVELRPMDNDRQRLHLSLLATLAPAAYNDPVQFPCVVARMARLSLVHGSTPHTPVAFALAGAAILTAGDTESGYQLGRAAVEMAARQGSAAIISQVRYLFASLLRHWREPLHLCQAELEEAYAGALETGNMPYAGWMAMNQVMAWVAMGRPTGQVLASLDGFLDTLERTIRYEDMKHVLLGIERATTAWTGDEALRDELDGRGYTADALLESLGHYPVGQGVVLVLHMLGHAVLGQWDEVYQVARQSEGPLSSMPGGLLSADLVLLVGLAYAYRARDTRPGPRRTALLAGVRSRHEWLVEWAEGCPANHTHRAALLAAALAELQWDAEAAAQGWDEAMDAAAAADSVLYQGLAAEQAARFHGERRVFRSARHYLAEAREAWIRYGNAVRVAQLDAADPDLPRPIQLGPDTLDYRAIVLAAHALTRELQPDRLLEVLVSTAVQHTGATLGAVFVDGPEGLRVVACGGPECQEGPQRDVERMASTALVRFTVRTGELTALHDASVDARFATEGLARQRSVLCAPLIRRGEVVAALYLVNHHLRGAFTAPRIELVRVLLSLAATSLENARLYSRLHLDHERVLASTFDGVCRVGVDGSLEYANPATERITGWDAVDLVGTRVSELVGGYDPAVEVGPHEASIPGREGSSVEVEWASRPILDRSGRLLGAVLTLRDLSARKGLEAQLRQSQKLEAVGQLSGGLAHDLNNLLTPVLGNLALLSGALPADSNLASNLDAARTAARRAAGLVGQMLAFSRRTEVNQRPVDPAPLVVEVAGFLRGSLDPRVEIRQAVAPDLGWVCADPGQLHQVLLNLCINARDALGPGGGLIQISARDATLSTTLPGLVGPRFPGDWVVLTVGDDGLGMDPGSVERVFEPFFSTKEDGTGLGLAVVWGIVEQHRGSVVLETRPGQGTTIEVWLPAVPALRAILLEEEGAPLTGEGSILVVDDEQLVLELGERFLQHLGYEVRTADSGPAALELYGQQPSDVVLLDLSMPVMDGRATLAALLELDPACKVVLWSGYDDASTQAMAEELGARAFLAKPFRVQDLARVVHTVLMEAS